MSGRGLRGESDHAGGAARRFPQTVQRPATRLISSGSSVGRAVDCRGSAVQKSIGRWFKSGPEDVLTLQSDATRQTHPRKRGAALSKDQLLALQHSAIRARFSDNVRVSAASWSLVNTCEFGLALIPRDKPTNQPARL